MTECSFINRPVEDGESCQVCSVDHGGPPHLGGPLVEFDVVLGHLKPGYQTSAADIEQILVDISAGIRSCSYCVHPSSLDFQTEPGDARIPVEASESQELGQLTEADDEPDRSVRVTIRCDDADVVAVAAAMKTLGDTFVGMQFRVAAQALLREKTVLLTACPA
jgi:hypothetical protein